MRPAAAAALALLLAGLARADAVLITEPLTLTARLLSETPLVELQVSVPTAAGSVCVADVFRPAKDPLADYRGRIRRAGPYLFLPSGCGGCNAARGYGYAAFKLSPTVLSLGTVASQGGEALAQGRMLALESSLEINALSSHANGTVLELVLRERGGRLSLDRAATWARLRPHVAAALALRAPAPAEGLNEAARWDGPAGTLLRGAAAARYLGRAKEEARVLRRAEALLPAPLLATLRRELDRLRPGALDLAPFQRCAEGP